VYAVSGLPSGFSAAVTSVQYWVNGTAQAGCAANVPQLITAQVTYTGAAGAARTTNATFVVRDPQAPAAQVGTTASQLVFLTSGGPSDSTAGSPMSNQPLVAVEDSSGHIVTTDLSPVSLSITPNSGTPGATLANCAATNSYGVVNFTGCEIDQAGSGYTLTATNGALTPGLSRPFSVSPGPATNLMFTRSPVNTNGAQASTGGVVFAQQPTVTLRDAYGNAATGNTSTVTLAITAGTGPAGANLSCTPSTNQQPAANGAATFSGCRIDKANPGAPSSQATYTLTATDGSLGPAASITFTIAVGSAATLAFATQPGGTITGGQSFPIQPVVAVQDAGGNTVTTDNTSAVTLSITPSTGTPGAIISCPNPGSLTRTASNGLATFTRCRINQAGVGYSLQANRPGLAATTSSPFNVG
jgi:hypothetical protein